MLQPSTKAVLAIGGACLCLPMIAAFDLDQEKGQALDNALNELFRKERLAAAA